MWCHPRVRNSIASTMFSAKTSIVASQPEVRPRCELEISVTLQSYTLESYVLLFLYFGGKNGQRDDKMSPEPESKVVNSKWVKYHFWVNSLSLSHFKQTNNKISNCYSQTEKL